MTRERGAGQTKAEGEPAWIKCTAALISSADCLNGIVLFIYYLYMLIL